MTSYYHIFYQRCNLFHFGTLYSKWGIFDTFLKMR
jgi:hypothetical protein